MLQDIRDVLAGSSATWPEDVLGVTALFFLLVAGLHLPLFS